MSTADASVASCQASPVRAALSWRLLAIAVVVVAAHAPLLVLHARQIWLRPHYQFFPLVVVGAVALAYQRLAYQRVKHIGALRPDSGWASWLLVGTAWMMLSAAVLVESSWLGAVATLVLVVAVLRAIGGNRLLWACLPAWVFLWLAVPLPFELDRQLILALQSLTTRWSSKLLDVAGVYHVMAGHVVEIAGQRLFVEEACAGVNSLFSIFACTLFFVFWVGRPWRWSCVLLAAAVFWVIVANVLRVTVIAYAADRWGLNLAEGWVHTAAGLILFVLALGLIWSTDRLLAFLTTPRSSAVAPDPPSGASVSGPETSAGAAAWPGAADLKRTWLGAWPVAAAYALLVLAQSLWFDFGSAGVGGQADLVAAAIAGFDSDTLPERIGRWRRLAYTAGTRDPGSAYGEFSNTWTFATDHLRSTLSLDYPFQDWHDLTRCYTSQGWVVDNAHKHPADGARGGAIQLELIKPGYRCGFLVFGQFDRRAVALAPRLPGTELSFTRHDAALGKWWNRLSGAPETAAHAPPIYQFQVFVESYAPLGEEERAQAVELFRDAWQQLERKAAAQEKP